jgi:S1-C subfamily serine protease
VLAQGPIPAVAQQIRSSQILTALDDALPPPPDVFGRVAAYLDTQGFPQVFAGLGGTTAPPVDPPAEGAVAAAAAAGTPATVQVESLGCGGVSSGSGVVVQPGFIVTNAHVVAGGEVLNVRDGGGTHDAVAILVDPNLDLAVLSSPGAVATPLPWAVTPAERGVAGATLGFPGGQRELNIRPAAVRTRQEALGRDIYGGGVVSRQILVLESGVRPGDSGGPFVTADGQIGGIVFAASTSDGGLGFALTAERVRPDVDAAIARNTSVPTGPCRY